MIAATSIDRACEALELDRARVSLLGRGLFGEAWETPDGHVMKITSDPQEVKFITMAANEMRCPGVPVVHRAPLELERGVYAYEREPLANLPLFAPSLRALNVIARSVLPIAPEERIRRYDAILFSDEARSRFPYVVDAMRRFRTSGVLLWDCKRDNLGMRGTTVVIRDARTIDASAYL